MTAETYTFNNQTHTIAEWARLTNIPYSVLVQRLRVQRWAPERALTEPVRAHTGVQRRPSGYVIDVTYRGEHYRLSGFRTEPQARLARDELLRRLQVKHAVTVDPQPAPDDITANLGNTPYVRRVSESRQYRVNGHLAPISAHLRNHSIAPTSFYRLHRQTNLPVQDLLVLLLEHGLSFNDIRSRFKASGFCSGRRGSVTGVDSRLGPVHDCRLQVVHRLD